MKLGKEEIQKIVLGSLLFFGIVYSYFDLLMGPLKKGRVATLKNIESLAPEIAAAKAQIARTEAKEKSAPGAAVIVQQVSAMIPEGSPVAWFPTRIAEFFKRQGLDKAATRMNNEIPEKDLPGFRRIAWAVDLPKIDFVPFATALAALENEEPLVEISSVQIDASREDVQTQHALFTVSNIVK